MGDSYANQELETRGKDSHSVLINKALLKLSEITSSNRNDYFTYYHFLNQMRRKADYTNNMISQNNLKMTCDYAAEFLNNTAQLYTFAI